MATIHFNQITMSTPEHLVAALTDFEPGHSEVFGNSADSLRTADSRPRRSCSPNPG